MATVIIPETGRGDNPLTIYINGVKYSLPRGEEVTIPDAVAAEIRALNGELLPVSESQGDGDGGSAGGGVLVVHANEISSETNETKAQTRISGGATFPDSVLDKTWKEIYDAPFAVLKSKGHVYPLYYAANEQGIYVIEFTVAGSFTIDSENGYATNAENDLED